MTLPELEKLSDEEVRLEVGKILGWVNCRMAKFGSHIVPVGVPSVSIEIEEEIPNYSRDLNAIHDAVMSLSDEQQADFRRHLADVIHPGSGFSKLGHACVMSKETYAAWFNATARQRCHAFLLTKLN